MDELAGYGRLGQGLRPKVILLISGLIKEYLMFMVYGLIKETWGGAPKRSALGSGPHGQDRVGAEPRRLTRPQPCNG